MWSGYEPPDHVAPSPSDRARMILLDDHMLTNAEVALQARVRRDLVRAVRYQLVSVGAIPPSRVAEKRGPSSSRCPGRPGC